MLKERPFTRRGLLATVASIYDPLGFIAPFTLLGKRTLQQLCIDGLGWDDVISDDLRTKGSNGCVIFSNCNISISSVVSNLVAFQFIKQNFTTFVTPVYWDTVSVHTYAKLVPKVRYMCRSYLESLGLLLSNLSLFPDYIGVSRSSCEGSYNSK